MPELAEAETIRRQLVPEVTGKRITNVLLGPPPNMLRFPGNAQEFVHAVEGRWITRLIRRGKAIVIILDDIASLIIRLGMSGTLTVVPSETEMHAGNPSIKLRASGHATIDRHIHLRLGMEDGREIRLRDPRRFGGISLRQGTHIETMPEFSRYGPDALSDDFDVEYLLRKLRRRKQSIGVLLMDQSLVAGIGKIYSDEICFRAGVRPMRPGGMLTKKEAGKIVAATKETFQDAVRDMGTTAVDRTYRDAYNQPGGFQPSTYFRTGEPCFRCSAPIRRTNMPGGRGMHWCPRCQK